MNWRVLLTGLVVFGAILIACLVLTSSMQNKSSKVFPSKPAAKPESKEKAEEISSTYRPVIKVANGTAFVETMGEYPY